MESSAVPGPDDAASQEAAFAYVAQFLAANPDAAATVKHDLFAILEGRNTIGTYDLLSWWRIRRALDGLSVEDLSALLGPPGE